MSDWQYDNTAGLTSEFPGKRLGVLVSVPCAAWDGRAVCETQGLTINLDSRGWRSTISADCAEEYYRASTRRIVADLDAAIAELCAHRDRLAACLNGPDGAAAEELPHASK